MHVLLTNDDGISAEPLLLLCQELNRQHQVTVVAPDRERSAISHAITLNLPLRYRQVMISGCSHGIAVTGTPADCVKLALKELMPRKPDLVVSGINPGANVGVNINYSGTVAAAKEAVLSGIPALAISINSHEPLYLEESAKLTSRLIDQLWMDGMPEKVLINVNLPDRLSQDICGIQWCHQNNRISLDGLKKQTDPRGQVYFWYTFPDQQVTSSGDATESLVDTTLLKKGYITLTPIRCNLTDESVLQQMDQNTPKSFWANLKAMETVEPD